MFLLFVRDTTYCKEKTIEQINDYVGSRMQSPCLMYVFLIYIDIPDIKGSSNLTRTALHELND
jgi:hypothetical protein